MCGCRCCVSSIDNRRNTFLVLRLYLKSSIPSGSPARKGREVHEMRDFLRNQCGRMSDLKFLALRRTDEGDILYYRASSTRRAGVLLNVYFDKNKEITQFEIGPDDDQKQSQK